MCNSKETMSKIKNMHQLVWLISTIKKSGGITLRELSHRWVEDDLADGSPLARSTFNRHRDEIFELFGLVMSCDESYRYYFDNPEAIDDHSIESWLLSTMTVNAALSDSAAIRSRIILEDVPAGEQFLPTIIDGLKLGRRLRMGYQKFGSEPSERVVEPCALKLSRRRWYLLAGTEGRFKVFSLDRMYSLVMTDEHFEQPEGFSAEAYFAEYFGVLTDGTPLEHVVLRAYGKMADYLRTLPLHHSQREIYTREPTPCVNFADFELDIRPTADFIGELLSYDQGIEVLEPEALRLKIREKLREMLNRY